MRGNWTRALLVGAAVLLTPGVASAAAVTVPLHDAHRGATAAEFASADCAKDGATPPAGTVRWVFVLPHNDADFVRLVVAFSTPGGTVAVRIPDATDAYPDAITTNGTSKAWVVTPAGWTLQAGTAEVSGATRARFFNLTHTCPGASTSPSPSPSPSPSVSTSKSTSPSPSPSTSTSVSPSSSVKPSTSGTGSTEATASGSPSPSPATTPVGGTSGLPRTGTALSGMLLTGFAAIALGAALLWLRRRREQVTFVADEP